MFIHILLFYTAVGHNPKDLKIGIVNEEITDFQKCLNMSLTEWNCYDPMSCRFLNIIPSDLVDVVILSMHLFETILICIFFF